MSRLSGLLALLLASCPAKDDTAAPPVDTDPVPDSDCGGFHTGDTSGPDSGDTSGSTDTSASTDTSGEVDTGFPPRSTFDGRRIAGSVTWHLTFDEGAQAAGWTDCSYRRAYAGDQFVDQPYLCPDCDVLFKGTALMEEGFEDCYEPLFGGTAESTETWGIRLSDGTTAPGAFFRVNSENLPMSELAEIPVVGDDVPMTLAWTAEYDVNDEAGNVIGGMFLEATGEATMTVDPALQITDLSTPRNDPYACGWSTCNPGDLVTDQVFAQDAVAPNFWLEDDCGDQVELWDFWGSYVVLDSSSPDCGFCLVMAEEAPTFATAMADLGIPARVVTLLNASLSAVNQPPEDAAWASWLARYDHGEPILKDRGYGYATIGQVLGEDLGYPAWAILRPDLTVLAVGAGYDSWETFVMIIQADAGK